MEKAGADHKARFMSKVIYGAKMFLLKDLEFYETKLVEEDVEIDLKFASEYKENLERFIKFCSLRSLLPVLQFWRGCVF